jgi:hypothetical protein
MKNSPQRLKQTTSPRETGIALVTVLIMLVMVAALVSVTSLLALGNRQRSSDSAVTTQAQYAAEAAVELALKKIFYDPRSSWATSTDAAIKNADGNNVSFDSCAFKKWLTGYGNTATNAQRTSNNSADCPYVNFTATVASPAFAGLTNNATVTIKSSDTGAVAVPNATYQVSVTRVDQVGGSIELRMDAVGRVENSGKIVAERRLKRSVQIAADTFQGDKYGMLTSSTNCSFCHLQIDTMRRAYSTSTTATFPAARVGMLSVRAGTTLNLAEGHGGSDTIVHGSIYVRAPLSQINYDDDSTQSVPIDSSGNVLAGPNSSITKAGFKGANSVDAATLPGKNKRLYYNYPTAAEVKLAPYNGKWPDVELPDAFPSAVPDGGNFNISDAEWAAYVATAPRGKVVEPSSRILGAKVYGVRRPSTGASSVDTDIPYFYDPLIGTGNTAPATPTSIAQVSANPSTYKSWIIAQALASPNNRDFMPVLANAIEFTPATGQGTTRNNFYVRYNPTGSTPTLSLFYCTQTSAAACAIGGDPTANPTSSMASVSVGLTSADLFPSSSNSALDDVRSGTKSGTVGSFDGNLIIDAGTKYGTSNTALKLDGSIYINGDLVIRGRISGQGRIIARGNIYIVGDLVYDCSEGSTFKACGVSDYATPGNLPKLALLAGGNIVVGDYDFPDTRVDLANRNFDLINDQTGRNRIPDGSLNWDTFNIPGASGRPSYNGADNWDTTANTNTGGRAGFVTRMLMTPNSRVNTPRYFKMSPFGLMIGHSSTPETYENNDESKFISNINIKNSAGTVTGQASIVPMYPSNGPIRIGSRDGNNGLAYPSTVLNAALGCSNTTTALVNRRWGRDASWNLTAASVNTAQSFNFNYWCPPTTGNWVRRNDSTYASGNPGSSTLVWMAQSAQDAALDSGMGMTTGWLAGIVRFNGVNIRADLSQTKLLKLMWLSTIEASASRTKGPLHTDGIFYSANMMTSVLRGGADARAGDSNTQSRWIHNGSVIASELGFLITASNNGSFAAGTHKPTINRSTTMDFSAATGNGSASDAAGKGWGAGIGIFYDDRLSGFLQVTNTTEVKIRRAGVFNQEGR